MEKYLEKLLLQIRCKKARPYIAEEIKGHIESQIEDNIADGMSYEEAEKNAVADMGDPIAVGISLDKIHKPQIAWKLLVIVGILSLLGILLQQSIFYQSGYSNLEPFMQEMYQLETESFVYSVFIGFILMCGIYFIDYTVIAKYSKIIGLFIITMGILLLAGFFGGDINGVRYSIGFGMFRISATSLMMFYVPIYGAILYKYRDGGFPALLKSIVWLIIPVFITFRIGLKVSDAYGDLTFCNGIVKTQDGVISCTIDIRVPVTLKPDEVRRLCEDKLEDENGRIEILDIGDGLFFPRESPLVEALYKAYVDVTGDTANEPMVIGGGTYAKSLKNIIAFGPEKLGIDYHIHGADEYILVSGMEEAVLVYMEAIKNLLAI